MWILGNFHKDVLFLYVPAVISVILGYFIPNLGVTSVFYGLLAVGVIDSGHVYTTIWRTYLNPEERAGNLAYFILPFGFIFLFSAWAYLGIPYLWHFVVYATLYHHVRQVYGFSKWYQKLNSRTDKISDYFLYVLSVMPMVIYHFRPEAVSRYYTENDLFLFPDLMIKKILLIIYLMVMIFWLGYELSLWRKGIREPNRILSVGVPAGIYAFSFLLGTTITQILFPLLFLHGIAYMGVMGQSVNRTQKRFSVPWIALGVIVATAIFLGLGESWLEENIVEYENLAFTVLPSLIVGIWLTPLFCHYAFDAIIWRKGHREASAVFAKH